MDDQYQIEITQTEGGSGLIFIFQKNNPKPVNWFQISRDGHPIILAEFIDNETILAIDQTGFCGIFHIPQSKTIQTRQLVSHSFVSALLLTNKTQIALLTKDQFSTKKVLRILNISTLKEHIKLLLPAEADIKRIWQISEHQLGVYFMPGGSLNQESGDGFYLTDIQSQTTASKCFTYPSSCLYGPSPLDVSQKYQIGIRPRFDQIRLESKNNRTQCLIRVQLFHPLTGKELTVISVRTLLSEHIFEDTHPDTALENLNLPPGFDEYQETRDEVLDRITDIRICNNEPAFWIGFQHGLIRKISLDGNTKSPLLAHPGDVTQQDDPYLRTKCDNPILLSSPNTSLTFGCPEVSINLETLDLSQNEDIIILNEKNLNHPNKTLKNVRYELSWLIKSVETISDPELLFSGFNEIVTSLKNNPSMGDGNLFRFCFQDQTSKITEKEYFDQLSMSPVMAGQIDQYITQLLSTEKHLYYQIGIPSGCYAIKSLVLFDIQYVLLLNRYISSSMINIKDDPDILIAITNAVFKKYGWTKETLDLLLTSAYSQPGSGMDLFIDNWQSEPFQKQLKTSGLYDYLADHTIFQNLSNEYFPAIYPVEEALFSAIEKDKLQDVKRLLEHKALQIELKHPDFCCTALALAIQLENQQIIDILLENGANINSLDQSDLLYIVATKNNAFTDRERQIIEVTIETLNEEKQILTEQRSKIQYDELLSISTSKEQINQVKYLENRIQELETEIKFAELGLDKTGTQSIFDHHLSPYPKQQNSKTQYITEEIFFDEKFQKSFVIVENLNTYQSQSEAVDQMIQLTQNGYQDLITSQQKLRFCFKDKNEEWSEAEFYEHLQLDSILAEKLDQLIANLIQHASGALWCDDEMQSGMYAISTLTLFDKKYIERLIEYIKSKLIHHDYEKTYPSELVFDLLDEYGWCPEILKLVIIRAIKHGGEFAEDEFRILLKKGGLNHYLQQTESFQLCMDLITMEADNVAEIIQKYSSLIQQYNNY